MAGQKFEDAVEHGLCRRDVTQGKEFRNSTTVQSWMETGKLKQSLHFRRKSKEAAVQRVVERFYSQAIASAEKSFGARIPNRKGKHAPKMIDAVHAVLFVQMENGFRIAVRGITMAT